MLRLASLVSCLSIALLAGCSDAPPKEYDIKGQVKLDGKPMAQGKISFEVPGKVPLTLDIKDGAFSGKYVEGKAIVRVSLAKEGGEPVVMGDEKFPQMIETIAEKYNAETTLSADITPAGPNEFSYDVTSK